MHSRVRIERSAAILDSSGENPCRAAHWEHFSTDVRDFASTCAPVAIYTPCGLLLVGKILRTNGHRIRTASRTGID
jgi:hypothetical protein